MRSLEPVHGKFAESIGAETWGIGLDTLSPGVPATWVREIVTTRVLSSTKV